MSTKLRKTGKIWSRSIRSRSQIVRRVCETLEKSYGKPRFGNPSDPVDDLIYIIISNKTSPKIARKTYERVKSEFFTWNDITTTSRSKLQTLLKPAGLSTIKSEQIFATLSKIKRDFGTCTLDTLSEKAESEIETYLISLPGVSEKVAKCVMMYTMEIDVLPVDSHVHRVATRLGWTARKRADQCHNELEALVPAKRRYAFHVDCISHGRKICRPKNPSCNRCCIDQHCMYNNGRGVNGGKH